jgi:hypothetical protein
VRLGDKITVKPALRLPYNSNHVSVTVLGQEAGHLRTYRVLDDFYRLR